MRFVTQNANQGPTKIRIRKAHVIVLIDMWKCVAMRSFDPASARMMNAVRKATPRPVRTGTLRGRSRTWCSNLSFVTADSRNG